MIVAGGSERVAGDEGVGILSVGHVSDMVDGQGTDRSVGVLEEDGVEVARFGVETGVIAMGEDAEVETPHVYDLMVCIAVVVGYEHHEVGWAWGWVGG